MLSPVQRQTAPLGGADKEEEEIREHGDGGGDAVSASYLEESEIRIENEM